MLEKPRKPRTKEEREDPAQSAPRPKNKGKSEAQQTHNKNTKSEISTEELKQLLRKTRAKETETGIETIT